MQRCSGNPACCSDPRQSCFGKRRDAFFCYNDERAQMCPSPWQPTISRFIVYRNCNHADSNVAASESQNDGGYPTSFPNRLDKKKNGDIKQIMNYLRNCVRQRYIIDWTDEDDEQLLECSYNKVTSIHANKTEEVLHRVVEQAKRQKEDDVVMFVEKLLEKFFRTQSRRGTEGKRSANANRSGSSSRNFLNSNGVDNHKHHMECKCKHCQKEAAKSRNHTMDDIDYNKACPQCSRNGQSSSNQNGQPSCSQHGHSGCNEQDRSCDEHRPKPNGQRDPLPLRGGHDQMAYRSNQFFNDESLDDTDFIIPPRRISPLEYDSRYDNGTFHHRNHCMYANQPGSIDAFIAPNHLYNLHRMRM